MWYYYLIGVNVIGLLLFYIDKKRAIKHKYRIPEKYLFVIALIGGSIGSLFGMHLFHHKTKRFSFFIGLPLILIVQILLYYSVMNGIVF